jgi:hypothetical protein
VEWKSIEKHGNTSSGGKIVVDVPVSENRAALQIGVQCKVGRPSKKDAAYKNKDVDLKAALRRLFLFKETLPR